jgi:hypothetical protein
MNSAEACERVGASTGRRRHPLNWSSIQHTHPLLQPPAVCGRSLEVRRQFNSQLDEVGRAGVSSRWFVIGRFALLSNGVSEN